MWSRWESPFNWGNTWCSEQVFTSPDTALLHCQLALDIARKTGDTHTLARAHAITASAYRLLALFPRCEKEIQTAFKHAKSCSCCLAVVNRCLGNLRLYQKRFELAIKLFNEAIVHCQKHEDEDGVGRTLICRGVAWWRLGKIDAALEDERRAITLLSPDTPEFFYLAALTNTCAFLATGEDRHFVNAESFLDQFHRFLAGRSNVTAVRVRLSWTRGLVLARLGQRKRALQMLRKARKRFLNTRQDAEAVAITADIST